MIGLFTRDGHPLDLTLERHLSEDLSPEEQRDLHGHITSCPACTQRLEQLHRPMEALPALPVPRRPQLRLLKSPKEAAPTTAPSRRPSLLWLAPLLAIAAGLLLYIRIPPQEFTPRGGGGLLLEVYRETTGPSERLLPGDPVRAGDRLAFRVQNNRDGYLLVAGKDSSGALYACYPQGVEPGAVPVAGSPEPAALGVAIELDDRPGEERLIAVRCAEAFDLSLLRQKTLPESCVQVEVPLQKRPP